MIGISRGGFLPEESAGAIYTRGAAHEEEAREIASKG